MRMVKRYHPNGRLEAEFPASQGNGNVGIGRGWYENGQLQWQDSYVNGKLHGKQEKFHYDGVPCSPSYYIYGEEATEEEYRKHTLIERMAGIEE